MNSIMDLFKAETEIEIKAGELFAIMREAARSEFLLNAANCEVPHIYAREMATGEKEQQTDADGTRIYVKKDSKAAGDEKDVQSDAPAAGQIIGTGSAHVRRFYEQRVEWNDIQDIIRKGRAGVSLPPGTEINFKLKNGDPASAVVVGVDHYEKGDCVFWLRRIVARHCMNEDDTNEGGFAASAMRGYLNKDVIELFPDDLASVIVPQKMIQKIDGESVECEDRLFLPSEYELQGGNGFAEYNGQDEQFPFFEERRNRIAYDEDGDPCWYWTADPSSVDTTSFCLFSIYGYSYSADASIEGGVAPLFVIR